MSESDAGAVDVDRRLKDLGLTLPAAVAPLANYVPTLVASGPLLFVSGQLPMIGGAPSVIGHLGGGVTVDEGQEAARICGLNALAQVKAAVGGDWGRVAGCVKLTGFVASTPDFTDQPKVVNGASNLMVEALGEAGRHTRSAVGVAALPLGAAVEVEAIFALRA